MRKDYVKPTMESEAFVANEYVAACWTITCTNDDGSCGSITAKNDLPTGLTYDEASGNGTFSGTINGNSGCRTTISEKDYEFNNWGDFFAWLWDLFNGNTTQSSSFHPVSVTDGYIASDNKFHANASV